ncbi:MAG: hypothetical protein F6K04_26450, partial [Leptolyngbya sp. SIO4C5]|nr:hypothetical protein [Leptolyngbya sp. SIO4C5]
HAVEPGATDQHDAGRALGPGFARAVARTVVDGVLAAPSSTELVRVRSGMELY